MSRPSEQVTRWLLSAALLVVRPHAQEYAEQNGFLDWEVWSSQVTQAGDGSEDDEGGLRHIVKVPVLMYKEAIGGDPNQLLDREGKEIVYTVVFEVGGLISVRYGPGCGDGRPVRMGPVKGGE